MSPYLPSTQGMRRYLYKIDKVFVYKTNVS
jgi:hypothetical protein